MDGTHNRYEYIRHPGTWQEQIDSLHWHDQLSDNVKVEIDCTAQALNAWHIPDFIVWKLNQKFKKITVYPNFGGMIGIHILWHPHILSVKVLPNEFKKQVVEKYDETIKWVNTHYQPNHGKGVNKHNRMKAVANPMMAKTKAQMEVHSRILRQDGRNKKYKLERNVRVSSIWIKRKQHL